MLLPIIETVLSTYVLSALLEKGPNFREVTTGASNV